MDEAGILSFSDPRTERERVEAHPSPTVELTVAYFQVAKRHAHEARSRLGGPRVVDLLGPEHDHVLERIDRLASEGAPLTYELILLALDFGYVHDPSPERFLEDFPDLPRRFLDAAAGHDGDPGSAKQRSRIREAITKLTDPETNAYARTLLSDLWTALEPIWESQGRPAVRDACRRFVEAYRQKGDVLAALPPHHFTQFESAGGKIRSAPAHARIEVIPLQFSSAGGFLFHLHETYFIGFGLQSEQAHARAEEEVREVSARMKAFADPTRLMLLALLARYERFTLTVGDLAAQLGVTQPTVSGHLRMLKESGLVKWTKDGTKSYYHLVPDEVREALASVERLLDPGS